MCLTIDSKVKLPEAVDGWITVWKVLVCGLRGTISGYQYVLGRNVAPETYDCCPGPTLDGINDKGFHVFLTEKAAKRFWGYDYYTELHTCKIREEHVLGVGTMDCDQRYPQAVVSELILE